MQEKQQLIITITIIMLFAALGVQFYIDYNQSKKLASLERIVIESAKVVNFTNPDQNVDTIAISPKPRSTTIDQSVAFFEATTEITGVVLESSLNRLSVEAEIVDTKELLKLTELPKTLPTIKRTYTVSLPQNLPAILFHDGDLVKLKTEDYVYFTNTLKASSVEVLK